MRIFLLLIFLISQVSFGTYIAAPSLVSVTTTYSALRSDEIILADTTGAGFTITLPDATTNKRKVYVIKKTNVSGNTLTIGTTSSQTIDGKTTQTMTQQYTAVVLISDGSNWNLE